MKKLLLNFAVVALVFGIVTPTFATSTYTVQKGDSLYLIAKKLNLRFYDILRLNNHLENPALIYPNQKINIPSAPSTQQQQPQQPSDKTIASDYAQQVLQLVNAERSKQGLKALQLSTDVSKVATEKAKDMAVNNYFSHDSPTYGSPFDMMKRFGISYRTAGENIAAGQKTPSQVMQSWMNSSGHRANILNANYTEIGIGYYQGGRMSPYWVQQFIGK